MTLKEEQLLLIIETFYVTLYTNQATLDKEEYKQKSVKGSENIPDENIMTLRKIKKNKSCGDDVR